MNIGRLFNIWKDKTNPRSRDFGEGKHRGGACKASNWKQDLRAKRKAQRQAIKKVRQQAAGRKHRR